MKRIFVVLFLSLQLAQVVNSQIISEWRNLGRTGVYEEIGLLKEWPAEGPELLWVIDSIFPPGYSSVAIAHNTIYTTGIIDSMDAVIAVTMDGKVKWQTKYGRAWLESFIDSRSTPTIDGERLYVTSGYGDFACMNTSTGEIIWSKKASEELGGTYGKWGIAESPLILDNKVYYTPGGEQTTMVAFDKMNGEIIWKSETLNDNPSYVSPLLIERNGVKYIIQVTQNYVISINPEDGNILWKFNYGQFAGGKWMANIQANTPLYYNDCIYVTNGYDHKSVMLQLTDDSSKVYFKYVDTVLDVHTGGVVRIGDYIYGANWVHNRMGNWVCLNWNTGKPMYETEWENKGSIIAADGMLYCYDEKGGNIALVKADPQEFKIISEFKVPYGKGPHWSHLVIKDGILYVRHENALMAYKIKAE